MYDVVTLGETMLRMTPPGYRRISQTDYLEIEVGGSESNTAVGLAKLGLKTCWLSRLTDNPLGRRIANTLSVHGVDVSHVVWTDQDRIGLYFLEEGKPPRDSFVVYDRAGSAMSRMQPHELPDSVFQPSHARLLHLSGITPALSADAAHTARAALERAQACRWRMSFDMNYRAKLWSHQDALDGCEPFLQSAEIIFISSSDVIRLYALEYDTSPEFMLDALNRRYPHACIVLTNGAKGAMARDTNGTVVTQEAFYTDPTGRIGGGDAFNAGFLYGYLTYDDIAVALRWGAAVAALKYTIPGDMPLIERHEVERLVAGTALKTQVER